MGVPGASLPTAPRSETRSERASISHLQVKPEVWLGASTVSVFHLPEVHRTPVDHVSRQPWDKILNYQVGIWPAEV